jgi:hypothetical protein
MERLRNFFTQLLSEGTAVSSKRFSGLITLLNLIILTYISTVKNGTTPEYMYTTLAFLVGSLLGLTSIERIMMQKDDKKD